MDATLDFTRWAEKPLGVAYRRWVITSTGLRLLFRGKFFKFLFLLGCLSGLASATTGILFCQTITPGGWLEQLGAEFGPRGTAIAQSICTLILLYPDIVVKGVFSGVFFFHASFGLWLCLVALSVLVPSLVTRDRSSNALTIYLSRPLTSLDYLIGKFGIIVGVLLALWTIPLLFAWLLSVLFAPDSLFIVHSAEPLARALLFNVIALAVLAPIALGISSLSKTTAHTVLIWIGLWIVLGMLADIPFAPDWLKHASFSYDLERVKLAVFDASSILADAGRALPIPSSEFSQNMQSAAQFIAPSNIAGVIAGLAVLVGLSSFVFFRKLRAE